MTQAALTISYTQEEQSSADWLRLSQAAVTSNKLTNEDLEVMLALVKSGVSAHAYKPANCEASVLTDRVVADLTLKVWPSDINIVYDLSSELLTIGAAKSLQEWHEFDLIVPMASKVDLPYLCEDYTLAWQTPAYNSRGEEVEEPDVTRIGAVLYLSAEVFGVLRVKCLAVGWQHNLRFSWVKTEWQSITNVKLTVSASWIGGVESLTLELPGCLEALLAFCPDGNSKHSHGQSTVDSEEDEVISVVYYSPCSGKVIAVRQERP